MKRHSEISNKLTKLILVSFYTKVIFIDSFGVDQKIKEAKVKAR